jgi:hypothetical protein
MKIAAGLPDAVCDRRGDHASFTVRKKTFAYFLDNHHGDGIVSLCAKTIPGDNLMLAQSDPARFYLPAYIGHRGWVALRLDTGPVDWDEVTELLTESYRRTAPKTLTARLPGQPL